MYKILVCDDSIRFATILIEMIEKSVNMDDFELVVCYNGSDLMQHCVNNKFDIIFLDIEIGNENGISYAKVIKNMNPKVLLIYISGYEKYYKDMVNAEPFRFISKKINLKEMENEVKDSLIAAVSRLNRHDIWTFEFGKKRYCVQLEDIRYFYSVARTVHIKGDIGEAPSYFYGKIDDVEKEIKLISNEFLRINKSYLINMNHVESFGNDKVIVKNNEAIPVTRKYYEEYAKGVISLHWKKI